MQYKPKIGQRLLSMFLSVVMVATSTTLITVTNITQTEPTTAFAADSLKNNNLVMGPQYVSIDGMENDAEAAYNFQMLRFSLIKTGELTDTSTCTIVTATDVPES